MPVFSEQDNIFSSTTVYCVRVPSGEFRLEYLGTIPTHSCLYVVRFNRPDNSTAYTSRSVPNNTFIYVRRERMRGEKFERFATITNTDPTYLRIYATSRVSKSQFKIYSLSPSRQFETVTTT